MQIATVTARGQVTIPKHVRDFLNLKEGGKLAYKIKENGEVVIKPIKKHHLKDLKGILKPKKKLSLEEIEKTIEENWAKN